MIRGPARGRLSRPAPQHFFCNAWTSGCPDCSAAPDVAGKTWPVLSCIKLPPVSLSYPAVAGARPAFLPQPPGWHAFKRVRRCMPCGSESLYRHGRSSTRSPAMRCGPPNRPGSHHSQMFGLQTDFWLGVRFLAYGQFFPIVLPQRFSQYMQREGGSHRRIHRRRAD